MLFNSGMHVRYRGHDAVARGWLGMRARGAVGFVGQRHVGFALTFLFVFGVYRSTCTNLRDHDHMRNILTTLPQQPRRQRPKATKHYTKQTSKCWLAATAAAKTKNKTKRSPILADPANPRDVLQAEQAADAVHVRPHRVHARPVEATLMTPSPHHHRRRRRRSRRPREKE